MGIDAFSFDSICSAGRNLAMIDLNAVYQHYLQQLLTVRAVFNCFGTRWTRVTQDNHPLIVSG